MQLDQPVFHRAPTPDASAGTTLAWSETDQAAAAAVLERYGVQVVVCPADTPIPGSYFGTSEAGLIGDRLYLRTDTPLHSVMHEACHYICMDQGRRATLDTDAGGDYPEENAVCYLQILLADAIPGVGRARMVADMDAWGYTFRLGSAGAWFGEDAVDARDWLREHGLTDELDRPTWNRRD